MKQPSRELRYRRLIRQRRADNGLAKFGFVNHANTPYDPRHLGAFARWAGDLNAKVVIVLTDWRTLPQYLRQKGMPACCTALPDNTVHWERAANGYLLQLLQSVGYDIGLPQAPKPAGVFLADAVPFIGMGTVSKHARKCALKYSAANYLAPLLDIIEPRVVICVGAIPTNALFNHYCLAEPCVAPDIDKPDFMARMYYAPYEIRDGRTALFPVFHPGPLNQRKRSVDHHRDGFSLMLRDWARIKEWLVSCEPLASLESRVASRE